jgi:hypothetical protein
MKTIKRIFLFLLPLIGVAGLYFIYGLYINPKSPLGHVDHTLGETEINIRYYRPYKKDRLIFGTKEEGALIPYGEYWRLGANLTTKIKVSKAISFAGRPLDAGTYGLYAYPEKENWVIVVHTKTGGFSALEPDPAGVIMKVNTATQNLDKPLEQFTIDFVDNYLRMRWDTTQITLPIN